MSTIASLLIHLGVDTRDVKRDTRTVAPSAEAAGAEAGNRFTRGFRRGVAGFGSMVAGVAKTAAVGLAAVGLAAGGIGLQAAAGMQQAQIGFSTLLKDGKKAEAFLGDLQQFAAKTPFEFPGVRDAARQLLGVGRSAQSVIPTLTAFGDASGALGLSQEQFERAMLATTQAISKGKFQAEEILQITEAGIPVWPLLSRAMGKPVAELQKMAEKGKLVAADVLPKLEAQMRKDYGGSMARQSQTLTGLWSTLKDTISIGLGEAILPLAPALGRVASAATALADKGLKRLSAWIEGEGAPLIDALVAKLDGLGSGAAGSGVQWSKLGESLARLGPAVRDLAGSMPALNDVVNVGAIVLRFAADHSDLLAKALPYLAAGFILVKTAQVASNVAAAASIPLRVAEVIVQRRMVQSNLALAAAVQAQTAATVTSAVAETAATAATTAGDVAKKRSIISTIAMRAAAMGAAVASGVWTAAQWALNVALSANPIGLVILAIAALVAGIVLLWRNSETFRTVVLAVWGAVRMAIKATVDWVVGTAWPWLRRAWSAIADAVKIVWTTYTSIWGRVIGFVTGLPGRVTAAARGLWDGIVASARGAINTVISLWNRLDFGMSVSVPSWVPGAGGQRFAIPDLFPDLPMLARGGVITGGGSVVVGDGGGPEIVDLPRGARVTPLPAAGGGGAVTVVLRTKDKAMQWLLDQIEAVVEDHDDRAAAAATAGARL
ncbi:MAG TPA: tape measure protein [Micromonosporaceae bacterium]|nr:tape measure protein [Micromonosporaceae bacterium]